MAARPLVAWLVQELMFIKKLSLMLGSRKKLFFLFLPRMLSAVR